MVDLCDISKTPSRFSFSYKAFTLVELLVVVAIVSLLLGILSVTPGLLHSNRRVAALQQVSSVLEEARAQALRGHRNVYVVFAPLNTNNELQPCRQFAIFHENEDLQLSQASHWHTLPENLIFDPDTIASSSGAWTNLFQSQSDDLLKITLENQQTLTAPGVGFGKLGSVIHPTNQTGPIALVVAEGHIEQGHVQVPNPASNLSLEVRRNTGKTLIHP